MSTNFEIPLKYEQYLSLFGGKTDDENATTLGINTF
jgi:hypothetical protein